MAILLQQWLNVNTVGGTTKMNRLPKRFEDEQELVFDMDSDMLSSIPGYAGLYMASKSGHIYSSRKKRYLKERTSSNGYKNVCLTKNNESINYSVHRLIAMTFLGARKDGLQVNHKNGVKHDNTVRNLEWCTCSENHAHYYNKKSRKCIKGVYEHQRGGYYVRVQFKGKDNYLGYFKEKQKGVDALNKFLKENNIE